MKKCILFILLMVALQVNAQFTYSVKAGWSWPDFHNYMAKKEMSGLTLGGSVDYAFNGYFGLQSGLNYKRISYTEFYYGARSESSDEQFTSTMHYVEVPFLLTATTISNPQHWRTIWNAGMFVDIPVASKGQGCKGKTYYGLMAALQLEVFSHYFVRGEYQWALSSDEKGEWFENRRTNMLSVVLGYRF